MENGSCYGCVQESHNKHEDSYLIGSYHYGTHKCPTTNKDMQSHNREMGDGGNGNIESWNHGMSGNSPMIAVLTVLLVRSRTPPQNIYQSLIIRNWMRVLRRFRVGMTPMMEYSWDISQWTLVRKISRSLRQDAY